MFKKRLVVGLTLGLLSAMSCTKKGDTGPAGANGITGPAGPSYTGSISGHLILFDQYGSRVTTALNGTQISINGSNLSSMATADSAGYYIFDSVKTGSYSLATMKTGYGATLISNFQFLSGTLNRDVKMSAIPDFAPTSFNAYTTASGTGDSLVLMFTPDARIRSCMVFLNNNAAVYNLPSNYLLAYTKAIPANAARVIIVLPKQDLTDVGFATGNTVYMTAFGAAVSDASAYEDISSGKVTYNAVSTSSLAATAIVP